MPPDRAPPADLYWFVSVSCSLFAVVYIVWMVWELVPRISAGPIGFRLPLASLAKRSKPEQRVSAAASGFALIPMLLLLVSGRRPMADSAFLSLWLILILWVVVLVLGGSSFRWNNPRRDAKPERVLCAGLLTLGIMVVALAAAIWALQVSENRVHHPAAPFLLIALLALVTSAATLREYFSGTLLRERGIEILGTFVPWSRVVVKDWLSSADGYNLTLTVCSPKRFGMRLLPDGEVFVPVPASEHPALLIDFLEKHTTAPG
jgi:hypothetical protein